MGKEALRTAGVALNFIAFAFLLVGIYSDHWHEIFDEGGNSIINSNTYFEGIWNTCELKSTGHWTCYEQPGMNLEFGGSNDQSLPFVFYIFRGFTIISVALSFVGMTMFMAGLEGIRLSKGDKNMKLKISGGLNAVCFGMLLVVIILFRTFEFGENHFVGSSVVNQGGSGQESMGYGMWCAVGSMLFSLVASALCFVGLEDRGMYTDDVGYTPSQPAHNANTYI